MSANKYLTAGAPTGTSISNMDSRLKAWANVNAQPVGMTVRDSFNVASVTDVGVGTIKHNFTNAFANTEFAYAGHSADTAGGNQTATCGPHVVAVGSYQYNVKNAASTAVDQSHNGMLYAGDLA